MSASLIQGGTLPRAIWGTFHLLRQPIHVVQSRYSPMVRMMFSEYQNIIIFKDRNSPRSFHQLELLQVWWESAWEKTVETELNESGDLERQLFTLQVPPSPWGKLRRTWRSVGQVGNCLARASPRLDVAIFLENILWIPTRTWGSKPMSNILSASSRIIMVIRRRLVTWK